MLAPVAVGLGLGVWLIASQGRDRRPEGDFTPLRMPSLKVSRAERNDALARARVRLRDADAAYEPMNKAPYGESGDEPLPCQFRNKGPSGTTPKFSCVLADGSVIKVKYGLNPEIQAEVAATRLLDRLGYPADHVVIVDRLRCYGCPRYPFEATQVLTSLRSPDILPLQGFAGGYSDFTAVAVEQRFPAPAIETDAIEGWEWRELRKVTRAPPADVDALRLLAMFLAHWDNKSTNQRLVCLDEESTVRPSGSGRCEDPILMIQDLGATFGPYKANLSQWETLPVWADARACTVSMAAYPFSGATYPDWQISEAGRRQLADQLEAFSDADIRALFAEARFQTYYSSTDDERDLKAWTAAFRSRARQIAEAGPCFATGARR